eukprot:scaffold8859_cov169-Ochromonas_danica.AAC.6
MKRITYFTSAGTCLDHLDSFLLLMRMTESCGSGHGQGKVDFSITRSSDNSSSANSNFDHPGDLVLNEIHDMKEKILASQQVSILREAEREQWRRLVDSNIRSGTLACLWCLKTQYVKKLSVSFNKWKLFSALTEARRQREESPRRTASLALQNAIDVMNRLKPLDKKSSSSSSSSSSSYPQPSFKQLSSALQQADPEAKRRMLCKHYLVSLPRLF